MVNSEVFGNDRVRFAMVNFFEMSRHTMGVGPSQLHSANSEVFGNVGLRLATVDLFEASHRSMGLRISQLVRVHTDVFGNDRDSIQAMSGSKKIVELVRKQYTESNPQSTWMTLRSNFDDQLENLEDDGDRYKVESDSCSKHSDHHIKMLKKQ
ncbi:hypothetical protein FQA39_LY08783 [Lamprigera yunnana]|nr:hypothetical protein FQA39_LY08783 [Lamprigera yunnana]